MSGPKIFAARLCEMGERFDPQYHSPLFSQNLRQVRAKTHITVGECCVLSEETWDRVTLFPETFPYIEIGAISNDDGEIIAREELLTSEAPSRAQMVIRSGDILVSMTRPTRNAIARVTDDIGIAIASTGFAVIRSVNSNVVLSDYLFHTLRLGFSTLQFGQRSSGGNYPAITKDDLRKILLPLPPRDVQARIVAELDAAYAAKRKADAKAAELLASIDNIVLDALGIPPLPPLDTSLPARIFTISSQDTENNRLDAHHYEPYFRLNLERMQKICCQPLKSLVELSHDIWEQEKWNDENDGCFPYLEIGVISTEDGSVLDVSTIPIAEAPSRARMIANRGDLLVSLTRPTRGAIAFVPAAFDRLVASTGFAIIRKTKPSISKNYLFEILRTELCTLQFDQRSSGGNYPAITEDQLLKCKIPVPPVPVQKEIVDKVSAIRAEAKTLKASAAAALATSKKIIESILMEENKK